MSGSILSSAGLVVFKTAFQLSPIFLTGGIASLGLGILPLVAITQAADFVGSLLNGSPDIDLDTYFAHFHAAPGSTLIDDQIGQYPFANQTVAANAIIAQPLRVSMIMDCPAQNAGGYVAKLVTFLALQAALVQHRNAGGLYTVATPSFVYTNCILTRLVDISTGESKQPQVRWQFDFEQPLVTLQQAQQAQNALMSKVSAGLQTDGSLTGPAAATGAGSAYTQPFTGSIVGSGV